MATTIKIIKSGTPIDLLASLNYRQDKQVTWKKKVYTREDIKARKHIPLKDDGQAFTNGLSCRYTFKKDEFGKYVKFYALVNNLLTKEQVLIVYVEPQYLTDILIKEKSVKTDKTEYAVEETVKCTVEYLNPKKQKDVPEKDVPPSVKENVKWMVKIGDQKPERLITDDGEVVLGGRTSFKVPEKWAYKEVVLMPYLNKHSEKTSEKISIFVEEVLIVVGTEIHTKNTSNKLMFLGAALFIVRTKYPEHKHVKILVYTDGYSDIQLETFKKNVSAQNPNAEMIKINSTSELINYFNTGDSEGIVDADKKRKIKDIYIFAHGTFNDNNYGIIDFGMDGKNRETQFLGITEFEKISPDVFLPRKTHLYSYACRTGAGTNSVSNDPQKEKSLAQKMVNHGKIIVHAFIRRSDYENYIWGTKNHRRTYEADQNFWQYKIWQYKIYDAMNDDPSDQKEFEKYREKETQIDKCLWNPSGAYMLPEAGNSPSLFSAKYETFNPK